MLKRFVLNDTNKSRYKYELSLGNIVTATLAVHSSLVTFRDGLPYLILPKGNSSIEKEGSLWVVKRAKGLNTFAVFFYSGSIGKAEITKIDPEPTQKLIYRVADETGQNSVGIIFTIPKSIALISFKRTGKELPPELYEGTIAMFLNGRTKFI